MAKSVKKQAELSLQFLEVLGDRPPNQKLDVVTLDSYIPNLQEAMNQFLFHSRMRNKKIFWVDKQGFLWTVKNGKLVMARKEKVDWKRSDAGSCDWTDRTWRDVEHILLSMELVNSPERMEETLNHEWAHMAQTELPHEVKVSEVILDKTFQKTDKVGHDLSFFWFANQINAALPWMVPIFEGHHYTTHNSQQDFARAFYQSEYRSRHLGRENARLMMESLPVEPSALQIEEINDSMLNLSVVEMNEYRVYFFILRTLPAHFHIGKRGV